MSVCNLCEIQGQTLGRRITCMKEGSASAVAEGHTEIHQFALGFLAWLRERGQRSG